MRITHLDGVMEQLLYLVITLITSSSIISAGNDTNVLISTTILPNTTTLSQLDDSKTAAQTNPEISVTSHRDDHVMTSHTFKTVSTTTADLLSSSHTTLGTTPAPAQNRQSSSNDTSARHNIVTSSPLTRSFYTEATQYTVSPVVTTKVDVSGSITPTVESNITMSEVTASPALLSGNSLTTLAFGVMSLILILIIVMVILVTTINLRGRCRSTKQQEDNKNNDSMVSDSNMTNNCEKESITLVSVRTINTDYDTDSPQVSSVRSIIVDNEDQEFNRDLLNIKGWL